MGANVEQRMGGRKDPASVRAMRLASRLAWFVVAVPLLVCACVGTTSVVRSRFAVAQDCPEDQVVVDQEGATQYRARGCEKETAYVCSATAAMKGGVECVEEGLPNPPAYREPDRPVMPPPDPRILPSR
jgi:hypothetical protein